MSFIDSWFLRACISFGNQVTPILVYGHALAHARDRHFLKQNPRANQYRNDLIADYGSQIVNPFFSQVDQPIYDISPFLPFLDQLDEHLQTALQQGAYVTYLDHRTPRRSDRCFQFVCGTGLIVIVRNQPDENHRHHWILVSLQYTHREKRSLSRCSFADAMRTVLIQHQFASRKGTRSQFEYGDPQLWARFGRLSR